MKKIISALVLLTLCGIFNFCSAKDVWVYNYPNGNSIYIVYESVVYSVRGGGGFYAKANVKYVHKNGELIKNERLEFNQDEGDWWYGKADSNESGRRVYDYADSTEILNWLKEHRNEAHRTANQGILVLSD